jgi:hypothetical protein
MPATDVGGRLAAPITNSAVGSVREKPHDHLTIASPRKMHQ